MRLTAGADPVLELSHQVITAYLNVLSGATLQSSSFEMWKIGMSYDDDDDNNN